MGTKKYLVVFIITLAIFITAFSVSNYFNNKRIAQVQDIADKISIDLLSSETQFSLLAESSCKDISEATTLSGELNSLAEKLTYTENELGSNSEEVLRLKRYYSLLQIKDFLLTKRISEKCGIKPVVILYFYSKAEDCKECSKTADVLTYLRGTYPAVRVYSFDYNFDLGAIKTMISIFKVKNTLPAIVVDDEVKYQLTDLASFEREIPQLKVLELELKKAESLKNATSSPTSTSTKRN